MDRFKIIFLIIVAILLLIGITAFIIDKNNNSSNQILQNTTNITSSTNTTINPIPHMNISNQTINQNNTCQIAEICDGLDNNCNSLIDENVICNNSLLISLGETYINLKSINEDTWIEKIGSLNENSIIFSNTPLFSIESISPSSNNQLTPISLSNPNYSIITQSESKLVWVGLSPFNIDVEVSFKKSLNKSIDFKINLTNSGQRAIKSVLFPKVVLNSLTENSDEKEYLASSTYGGAIQQIYGLDLPQLTWRLPGELPTQYLSIYTNSRAKQFFMQTTDSEGYVKDFIVFPNKTSKQTSVSVKQYPENNLESGNDYYSSYSVRFAVLSGNWFDAAKFYRKWALQQPWVRAPLEISNDVSPLLKNLKLFTLISTSETNSSTFEGYHQSLVQLKNYYSFNDWELMSVWYRWHNNSFDQELPDHLPPREGVISALTSTINNGIAVIPYTLNGLWAIGTQSYIQNNIDTLVSRNENGQITTTFSGLQTMLQAYLDPSVSTARSLVKNNILDIINLGFSGLYWDAFGTLPPQLDYSSEHNHPQGGGKYWTQGKIQLYTETHNSLKQINQNQFISSEWLNEYLLNSVELVYTQYVSLGVVPIPIVKTIYGDRVFISDLSLQTGLETLATEYYKQVDSFMFHNGEIASISNWESSTNNFIDENLSTEKQDVLNYRKVLINNIATRKYQRFGEFLHPLPGSILDIYDLSIFGSTNLASVMSSVWKASNGDIGIIITNSNNNSSYFDISMAYSMYELSGEYTLYENINGQRIAINPLVTGNIYLSVTMEPNSLKLFELVPQ